ncbi:2,3-bisphosphoglycerate-independent phosphoglycerate mutase [Pelagibaculum spongiae]|uniref:2,3-bisphosphoglycerate-independent phosphoglycerate mutase n=1 Tax=Pelagibaculum spongiae TaxID=2080658 RepID=A0A2V1GZJ8_9GAMM|nr:2,3-bisphosphoglycerate-independent phosphoglycerate mutase [Pelagibaculum spongiae]PVZ68425.1 2,3-bisphosphoglycerate-independent phosphoglycerate mutase [Pelagibaculum spongiae]
MTASSAKKPLALIILDGWGHRVATDFNAIHTAKTPNFDKLWDECPSTLISASGMDVGLPDGQMGNSEVGHLNLGAGRVVYQELTRVTKSVADGDFFENEALTTAVDKAIANNGAVHLMGLMSQGGVHSHEDHIFAMMRLAAERGAKKVFLHAFLDGRDTPPRSAKPSLEKADAVFAELFADREGEGRVASVIGRYFAMDRDQRWERVEVAYDLITQAKSEFAATSAVEALEAGYARDENDEFIAATAIQAQGQSVAELNDGDALIFMNFRADRARQITRSFVNADFDGFPRAKQPALSDFVMLTQYAADIKTSCAFPANSLSNVLGEYLQSQGKTQLRIAETEKYAHVTFFFSGGREDEFEGETRILIPSPKVATYDLQPEMNAPLLTEKLQHALTCGEYDAIICNYANSDMVGHTGSFEAAVQAIEALDDCIGKVVATVREAGAECLITADHGNSEKMRDEQTGQAHTAHTSEPVPFIYVGRDAQAVEGGMLSDVAPTMLALMGLDQPAEMTGKPLMLVK